MKLVSFVIAVVAVVALGGLFGFTLGNGSGAQVIVPEKGVVAQPEAAESSSAVESTVGVVGVLQAVGSDSLSVQTREGMTLLSINGTAGIESGSSAIDQLRVGDKVAVWAQEVNGQIVVRKVVVVPQSPERMHYMGLVTSAAADRIDVVGQQGETTSFRIDTTLQRLPNPSHAPQIGDKVTVVAKPDPLGDGWLAVAIVTQ